MVCKCATYYRPSAGAATDVATTEDVAGFTYKTGIKGQSLVNQRKNCRARSATKNPMPKKCRTNRPQKGFGSTCRARLTFYADNEHDRFSIHAYNGNRHHSNHHQVKASEIPIGGRCYLYCMGAEYLNRKKRGKKKKKSLIRNMVLALRIYFSY